MTKPNFDTKFARKLAAEYVDNFDISEEEPVQSMLTAISALMEINATEKEISVVTGLPLHIVREYIAQVTESDIDEQNLEDDKYDTVIMGILRVLNVENGEIGESPVCVRVQSDDYAVAYGIAGAAIKLASENITRDEESPDIVLGFTLINNPMVVQILSCYDKLYGIDSDEFPVLDTGDTVFVIDSDETEDMEVEEKFDYFFGAKASDYDNEHKECKSCSEFCEKLGLFEDDDINDLSEMLEYIKNHCNEFNDDYDEDDVAGGTIVFGGNIESAPKHVREFLESIGIDPNTDGKEQVVRLSREDTLRFMEISKAAQSEN